WRLSGQRTGNPRHIALDEVHSPASVYRCSCVLDGPTPALALLLDQPKIGAATWGLRAPLRRGEGRKRMPRPGFHDTKDGPYIRRMIRYQDQHSLMTRGAVERDGDVDCCTEPIAWLAGSLVNPVRSYYTATVLLGDVYPNRPEFPCATK